MRPSNTIVIVLAVLVASVPFVFWGILVVLARLWNPNMRRVLPWLRTIRWIVWGLGNILVFVVLGLPHKYFWLFGIAMCIVSIGPGLAPVERWVKKRFAPELLDPKSDGSVSAIQH